MRIHWVVRFARTLISVGLGGTVSLLAGPLLAAPLNTNLVLNPGFESIAGGQVDTWTGALRTWAYSANYTGAALPGAGSRYWFGGNGNSVSATQPAITLATNAADIDAGRLNYNLSAFFSSYRQQQDYGTVTATFLDAGSSPISSASIGSLGFIQSLPLGNNGAYNDARSWGQAASNALVPAGTRSVRIDVAAFKEPGVGEAIDGYIDNVGFQLSEAPIVVDAPTLWNFDNAENRLAAAGGPGVMTYHDPGSTGWGPTQTQFGSASSFGLPLLPNGSGGLVDANVMAFPKTTQAQGYRVAHHNAPNGVHGDAGRLSNYTMVFDVFYPQASDATWRAIYQTDPLNASDAELYINDVASGGIGINGQYHGALTPGEWHRVAVVVRSADGEGQMQKFINGKFVGAQGTTGSAISSRWSLGPDFLLFTDDNAETNAGYVSSIFFEDRLLDFTQIVALGGPNAAGANVPGILAEPVGILAPRRIDIIAHRGYGNLSNAPENTLAGHATAWAGGARYIESDVRVTADGVAVLFHDSTLDRTTTGTGSIASKTLAEVQAVDAGSWAGDQFIGEHVPTLREAIEFSQGKGDLYLDVKVNGQNVVDSIKNAIDEAGIDGSTLLIWNYNNDADTVRYRQAIPGARIIYEPNQGIVNQSAPAQEAYFQGLKNLGVWGFDAGAGQGTISEAFVDAAHERGFWVAAYTILSPDAMVTAINRGVDAMETDFPQYLNEIMPEYGDANLDGVVDRADVAILAANFGRAGDAEWSHGDFDLPYLDNSVSLADLARLQAHFTAGGGASPSSVAGGNTPLPEPSTLWLSVVGGGGALACVRRRKRSNAIG
jgi:glycerophosphoryl diester phosphodiesterase